MNDLSYVMRSSSAAGAPGDEVTAGLDGSLSFVMVVGRRSDCAVDTALRAAGVGLLAWHMMIEQLMNT